MAFAKDNEIDFDRFEAGKAAEATRSLISIAEEVVAENELITLLNSPLVPRCYDGFEPSGRMHIAQGLMKTLYVRKMLDAKCDVVLWIADWFAQLNNKMGGDLKKIQTVGKYMIEVWKSCGMPVDNENLKFLWASEEIDKHSDVYWSLVMDICRTFNITRLKRCTKILGRTEAQEEIEDIMRKINEKKNQFEQMRETGDVNWDLIDSIFDDYEDAISSGKKTDTLPTAYLLYAAMQCADIYFLGAHICQLGMDQRKVNVLAREYHSHLFRPQKPIVPYRSPPIILSHHMLMGLKEGQEKMSKSDPESAIFMEDSEMDVNRKIKKAFCKPQMVNHNPIMDYFKHIIFPYCEMEHQPLIVKKGKRSKFDQDRTYATYDAFEKDYVDGILHPSEVKPTLAREINRLLQPVRDHFKNNEEAKLLLKQVVKFKITK